jgi:hypothetical protein
MNLISEFLKIGRIERASRLAGEFLIHIPTNHPNRKFFENYGAFYFRAKKKQKKRKK